MGESFSVEAILTAKDAGFTAGFKAAQKQASGLGHTVKSGLGFGALAGIGNRAVGVITKGLSSIASHTGDAVKRVDTLNNFPKIMKNLGYSTKDAEKAINKMSDGIDGLPTALDDIASATQKIAPLTGSLSKATDVSLALNNALLAGGKSTEVQSNALEQYSQMLSVGKVDMQAWRSLVTAMPGQMDQLSKSILGSKGKTMDLYDAMKTGKVSFDDFNNALLQLNTKGLKGYASFSDQAKDATKGIQTGMKNVGTAITKGLANSIKSVDGLLSRLNLPSISEGFDFIKGKINSAFSAINGYIDGLDASKIKELINTAKAGVGAFAGFQIASAGLSAVGPVKQGLSVMSSGLTKFGATAKTTSITASKAFMDMLPPSALNRISGFKASLGSLKQTMVASGQGFAWYLKNMSPMSGVLTKMSASMGGFGQAFGIASKVAGVEMKGLVLMMNLALKAIFPAALIGAVLAGLGLLYQNFGTQIDQMIATAQTKGPQIIQNLGNSITSALPGLIAQGAQLVAGLLDAITANIPAVMSAGVQIISTLVSGLGSALPTIIPSAINCVMTFISSILSAIPQLISVGMQFLAQLVQGIVANIPLLLSQGQNAISNFISGLSQQLPSILNSAVQIITTLIQGIVQNIPQIITTGIELIIQLGQAILQNLPQIIEAGVQIIVSLATGLIQAIPELLSAMGEGLKMLWDTIVHTDWLALGGKIIKAIGTGIFKGLGGIGGKIANFFGIKTDWSGSGKKGGTKVSQGTAQGINSGKGAITSASSGLGKSAGTALNTSFKPATTQFSTTLKTTGQKAGTQGVSGIKAGLSKGPSIASSSGKKTGTNYAKGVKSGTAKAKSVAHSTVTSVNSTFRSGVGGARSAGSAIGAGVASGLRSQVGAVRAAAAAIASAAAAAMRAKAQIHSPSKLTNKKVGKPMGQGVAKGLKKSTKTVKKAGSSLIKSAFKTDGKSIANMAKTGKSYFKNVKTSVVKNNKWASAGYSLAGDKLKKTIKTDFTKKQNDALAKAKPSKKQMKNKNVKAIYNQYSKYLKEATSKIISQIESTIDKLTEKYEELYKKIDEKRSNYISKLSDYGELFTTDDYGYMAFKDFKKATEQIKQYGNNIERLKKLLPDGLMEEILQLDSSQGLQYTNQLLKMSESQLKEYGKSYTTFVKTADSIGHTYYQPQLDALKKNFNNEFTKAMSTLQSQMNKIGMDAVNGFIKGVKGKNKELKKVAKSLASSLTKTVKSTLGIHSPSKVFAWLGRMVGAGFVNGIDRMAGTVLRAEQSMISLPSLQGSRMAFEGPGLSDAYNYNQSYEITVITDLDGKEVARTIARPMEEELNKRNRHNNRKNGIA